MICFVKDRLYRLASNGAGHFCFLEGCRADPKHTDDSGKTSFLTIISSQVSFLPFLGGKAPHCT